MADILQPVQTQIDDVVRANIEALRNAIEEGEEVTVSEGALLGGWVMITDWIDPLDGEHWYYRITSTSLPPHSRLGLLYTALEMED